MHYIDVGPVPAEETAAQIGTTDFPEQSRLECKVYSRMLNRLFPIPAGLPVAYRTREHPHDFGTYRDVAIRFDESSAAAMDFAYQVERSIPDKWDPIAQYELAWYERRRAYADALREERLKLTEVPSHFNKFDPPTVPHDTSFAALLAAYPL